MSDDPCARPCRGRGACCSTTAGLLLIIPSDPGTQYAVAIIPSLAGTRSANLARKNSRRIFCRASSVHRSRSGLNTEKGARVESARECRDYACLLSPAYSSPRTCACCAWRSFYERDYDLRLSQLKNFAFRCFLHLAESIRVRRRRETLVSSPMRPYAGQADAGEARRNLF